MTVLRAVALASIFATTPAFAGGATVVHEDIDEEDCRSIPFIGFTICVGYEGTVTEVETASGNVLATFRGTRTLKSWRFGKPLQDRTEELHEVELIKDGSQHMLHLSTAGTETFDNGFVCWEADIDFSLQIANGEVVKRDNSTVYYDCE